MRKIICALLAFIVSCFPCVGRVINHSEKGNSEEIFFFSPTLVSGTVELKAEFERAKVNTLVIEFEKDGQELVEILSDGVLLYSREGTEKTRFCAFKTLKTDNISVRITGVEMKLTSAHLSRKSVENLGFRVTSYFVASTISKEGSINPKCFDIITDAILFGCVTFDEDGVLTVERTLLESALKNLRDTVGHRDVNIYINILGPDIGGEHPDWYEYMSQKAQLHSNAFKSSGMEEQISALLDEYDFDGVFFDYEYPIKAKYWRDFSNFLISLNKSTDKKIGLAFADWDIGLSGRALNAVDMVEMMEYDLFNEQGNHSDFDSAMSGIKAARDYFISDIKIDLGVPFYGRPSDGGAFWYNYNQYASTLGTSSDATEIDGKTAYFNSWQTIYDKTAYAIYCGIGGMMVWHYSCDVFDTDSELSLFGAIGDCIADRNALTLY